MVNGPDWNDKNHKMRTDELNRSIISQNVSVQVKFDMMQRTVATDPQVNMGTCCHMCCGRKKIPSLLDSVSQVTIVCQSYVEREMLPHIIPADEEKAEAYQLFQLTTANNGKLPMSMYVKLDLEQFWEIMVPKFGVLITQQHIKALSYTRGFPKWC